MIVLAWFCTFVVTVLLGTSIWYNGTLVGRKDQLMTQLNDVISDQKACVSGLLWRERRIAEGMVLRRQEAAARARAAHGLPRVEAAATTAERVP